MDLVTTVLELTAVALATVAATLVTVALIGGLLGLGMGCAAAAAVLATSSGIIRWMTINESDQEDDPT